jgi:hypothetical protein
LSQPQQFPYQHAPQPGQSAPPGYPPPGQSPPPGYPTQPGQSPPARPPHQYAPLPGQHPSPYPGQSGPSAAPPVKKKGGVRKVVGILMAVFSLLPVLAGGAVIAKNFINAQQHQTNPAFPPKAWHNLPTDKIMPDRFGLHYFREIWSRQGVDKEVGCDRPVLEPEFAKAVNDGGCEAVVRATYVDTTGTLVATLDLIRLGSVKDASEVSEEFSSAAGYHKQLVKAYPVSQTAAAGWSDRRRAGRGIAVGAIGGPGYDAPYLLAVTLGYVDGRAVSKLPEPWTLPAPGAANEYALDSEASSIIFQFNDTLESIIREAGK